MRLCRFCRTQCISSDALPGPSDQLCTRSDRDALRTFYAGDKLKVPGAPYNLAQALEALELCAANVAWQAGAH